LNREELGWLARSRLDAVSVFGVNESGNAVSLEFAHLMPQPPRRPDEPPRSGLPNLFRSGIVDPYRGQPAGFDEFIEGLEREIFEAAEPDLAARANEQERKPKATSAAFQKHSIAVNRERAFLVHVGPEPKIEAQEQMDELEALAHAAEVEVVGRVVQRMSRVDPKTLIGSGRLESVAVECAERGAKLLIFNQQISPRQVRNITDRVPLKVVDRTQLILDIFARRARSREGQLQVELAQLRYTLPRLSEKNTAMSRLAGGIGGQGPGETKLELNRRRSRERIHRLQTELDRITERRERLRQDRRRSGIPLVSLVGYTNSGKSTLFNSLTSAGVLAADMLFATLDPTSRRLYLGPGEECLLIDTVGFVTRLPADLVRAFKATLEELSDSSLLLHVQDVSSPHWIEHREGVEEVLKELGLSEIPRLEVMNKVDLVPEHSMERRLWPRGAIPVSALKKEGLRELIKAIANHLPPMSTDGDRPGISSETATEMAT
jgi:GTP-binding protein HflX